MLDTARCQLDVGNDVQQACKLRLTNYKFARQQDEREDDWVLDGLCVVAASNRA